MKIPLLDELSNEINRLIIAGSRFAKNDPRLAQFVPKLGALSEKAPIFKKLADDMNALLSTQDDLLSPKLLSLNNLLTAINLTQLENQNSHQEKLSLEPQLKIKDVDVPLSYKKIAPLIKILKGKGAGRYSNLSEHFSYNQIEDDWRLHYFMDLALTDKNHDLVTYLHTKIIPHLDDQIVPFLHHSFIHQPKARDLRLSLIFQKNALLGKQLAVESLESQQWGNDVKLKVVALSIVANDAQYEDLILSYLNHKKIDIRVAVYNALGVINSAENRKILVDHLINHRDVAAETELTDILSKLSLVEYSTEILSLVQSRLSAFNAVAIIEKNANRATQVQRENAIKSLNSMIPLLFSITDKSVLDFYDALFHIIGDPNYSMNLRVYWMGDEISLKGIANHLACLGELGVEFIHRLYQNADINTQIKSLFACNAFTIIQLNRGKQAAFDLFKPYIYSLGNVFEYALVLNRKNTVNNALYSSFMFNWENHDTRLKSLDDRWWDLIIERFNEHYVLHDIHRISTIDIMANLQNSQFILMNNANVAEDQLRQIAECFFEMSIDYPKYAEVFLSYFEHISKPSVPVVSRFIYSSNMIELMLKVFAHPDSPLKEKLLRGVISYLENMLARLVITQPEPQSDIPAQGVSNETLAILEWWEEALNQIEAIDVLPQAIQPLMHSLYEIFTAFFSAMRQRKEYVEMNRRNEERFKSLFTLEEKLFAKFQKLGISLIPNR